MLAPASAEAQNLPLARTDQGRWADVIAASRGKLDSLRRTMSIPGLSISVSVDRRVVWSEGFAHGHLEPGLFRQETLDLVWTSQRTAAGEETGVGIGWRLFRPSRVGGRRAVGHAGGAIGGNALLMIYPDDGMAVAVAANIADIGYPEGGALVFGNLIAEIADLFIEAR